MKIHYHLRKLLACIAIAAAYTCGTASAEDAVTYTLNGVQTTWDWSETHNRLADLQPAPATDGNKVKVDDITSSSTSVYGAYGDDACSNNELTVTDSSLSKIYGGESYLAGASSNVVNVSNSTASNVGGGFTKSSSSSDASQNKVNVTDSTVKTNLYGGHSYQANTKENVVTVNNSTVGDLYGGYAPRGEASDNKVIVNNAGLNQEKSQITTIYGGYSSNANATGNSVTVENASLANAYAGYVTSSANNTASGNSLSLTNSSVSNRVYGGYVYGPGNTTSNVIVLEGCTIQGNISGGRIDNGIGNATGNTVTLKGSGDFSKANIYGGSAWDAYKDKCDLVTGNKLVLDNFNGSLGTVTNFETIYTTDGTTDADGNAVAGATTTTITGGKLTANSMSFEGETSISNATLTATAGDIDFTGSSLTLSNTTLTVDEDYEIFVDGKTQLTLGSGVTFNGNFVYNPESEGEESGPSIGLGTGKEENNEYVLTDSVKDLVSTPGAELEVNTENLVIANSGLSADSSIVTTQTSGNIEIAETAGDAMPGEKVTYTLGTLNTSSASTEDGGSGIMLSNNIFMAGDTTTYKGNLIKNEHTTQRIDVSVAQAEGEAPAIVTDTVKVEGKLDAKGARVLLSSPTSKLRMARAAAPAVGNGDFVLADQTVQRIVEAKEVISGYDEDVKYEIDEATGQRKLQSMNAWVRTTDDGAEFVFNQNYRSAEGKSAIQQAVSEVLQQVSPNYGQADGERAASASRFANMLDAFDHTRSAGAAKRGLTSVSGVSTTIAQHAVMDSSRHHMDNLRRWISLPECPVKTTAAPAPVTVAADGKAPRTVAAAPVKEDPRSSVWATYTGGHDMVDDPAHEMGGYTRSSHGALMGYSRSVNCNLLLGLALGYENSISRSDLTRHDADSGYLDLYGAARTGRYNHRFSAGVGFHAFDATRGVYVEAPGHSFSGKGASDFDARSINLGYELSTDVALSERAFLSPFVALNYAHHSFDTVRETGLGDAGLITELESINQLEAALGARYAYGFNLVKNQAPATFTASAELKAEFADHAPNAYSRFAEHEGLNFRTESLERSPIYGEIGVGLKVPFATQWTGSASASYEFGSDRNAINVGAGVNYSF